MFCDTRLPSSNYGSSESGILIGTTSFESKSSLFDTSVADISKQCAINTTALAFGYRHRNTSKNYEITVALMLPCVWLQQSSICQILERFLNIWERLASFWLGKCTDSQCTPSALMKTQTAKTNRSSVQSLIAPWIRRRCI